jgi:hypothetical protein
VFAGSTLQATATARAPGGVRGVRFELRAADGATVLASFDAAAPTGDPSNFAAQLALNGITDGAAKLYAVLDAVSGSATSEPTDVTVDLTPPAVALGTDGRTVFLGPSHPTASLVASAADSGAGLDAASVVLSAAGKTYPGVANGSQFVFSVPLADLGVADGQSAAIPFTIAARDAVGNVRTTSADPGAVLQVDLAKPAVTISTTATTWHAAGETVTIAGAASDAQSGLAGGSVSLSSDSAAGTLRAAGSLAADGSFQLAATLSGLTFANGFEGSVPYTVTVTDAAGNAQTATGSIDVDNAPPQIGAAALPPGDVAAGGHAWFRAGAGSLQVTAIVADVGSGVSPASVLLQLAPGSPGSLAPVSGIPGPGNTWTFALPRAAGTGLDGSQPVRLVVTASDTLGHAAVSAPQEIFFDDAAPVITKVADAAWYSASAANHLLTVRETIVDAGAGLASATLTVAGAAPVDGTCTPPGDCSFALDARLLPPATEGALAFTIAARDALSAAPADAHQASILDARNVDDKPPAVTIMRVTNADRPSPASSGVAYPPATVNTGYDGSHFVYVDTLTISGTIQDSGAGIDASAVSFEVQGEPVASAPRIAIAGCSDGTTQVCSFSATVKLNDPAQAGAFHAADAAMQVVVHAADKAVDAAQAAAGNAGGSVPTAFAVTRLWWKAPVGTAQISGLAIVPSGAVVATTSNTSGDTVFALKHDGSANAAGATLWQKGAGFYSTGSDLGSIEASPAIGAGNSPNIYVPTTAGDVVSFDASGNTVWNCGSGNLIDPIRHAATVLPSARVGATSSCEAVVAGADNSTLWAVCGTAPNVCTERPASAVANGASNAITLGAEVYVATGSAVSETNLLANGNLAAISTFSTNDPGAFGNLLTDGSVLFAFNNILQKTYSFDQTGAVLFAKTLFNAVEGAPVVMSSSSPIPGLLFSENSKAPASSLFVLPTDGAAPAETGVVPFGKLPSASSSPLLGSDNRIYADAGGTLAAVNPTQTPPFNVDWSFTLGATASFSAPPTMACDGTLYAAAGATIYAFVTDARGLADTPWPKYQRDTRNSGNADSAVLWGANIGGICTQ